MKKLICIALILCISFTFVACKDNTGALNSEDKELIIVEIPSGTSAQGICNILKENNIISDANAFKNYLKKEGYDRKLQAGKYTLSPSMDFEYLAEVLIKGKIAAKIVAIPEGYSLKQTAKKIADLGYGTLEEILAFMADTDFSSYPFIDESIGEKKLEGYLYPATYTVWVDATYDEIIYQMLDAFKTNVYDKYIGQIGNSTLREYIIKASLIERETANDNDRYLVASVINNRLKKGSKLRFDSTVQYLMIESTGKTKATLYYSDLAIDSPYNTYVYAGLPAGPICSPGLKSIDAAFNPAETNYVYFVLSAKLDGTSNFSSTYAQHKIYCAEYNAAIKEKNKNK